jgi:hypothetical protein
MEKTMKSIDQDQIKPIAISHLSVFVVSYQCLSVFICGYISVFGPVAIANKSRRAFHPRVWCWDGYALPRCMTAQPGG